MVTKEQYIQSLKDSIEAKQGKDIVDDFPDYLIEDVKDVLELFESTDESDIKIADSIIVCKNCTIIESDEDSEYGGCRYCKNGGNLPLQS